MLAYDTAYLNNDGDNDDDDGGIGNSVKEMRLIICEALICFE